MLMGSLQLLSLSFVGQYISRIYDEVKERPQFIIDEKINL
jgi:dolichol-phosphate mannosyltransferase